MNCQGEGGLGDPAKGPTLPEVGLNCLGVLALALGGRERCAPAEIAIRGVLRQEYRGAGDTKVLPSSQAEGGGLAVKSLS